MIDLKINNLTGDLEVANNKIFTTEEGSESIAQRLKIRLRFFFKEWTLDRSQGTKWFEIVLRKGVDKFAADSEVRRVILNTRDVKSIESWNSTLDAKTRSYSIEFDVKTTEGETLSFGFKDLLN